MKQRGTALWLLMLVLGVLGATLALRPWGVAPREPVSTAALAQAKDALRGFAATYAQNHSGEPNGYLPLPDLGTSRNGPFGNEEGFAAGNFSGNGTGRSVLGRLPWKTLKLGPLRDGSGECLWYAVSGSHQDTIKSVPLNWDTLGAFEPTASDGTSTGTLSSLGANPHQRGVAAVIAPGAALNGQQRANSGVDDVGECRGNYDARNYLDSVNPMAQLQQLVNYLSGLNHATGDFSLNAPKPLIGGPVRDPANRDVLINDTVLLLTPDELFAGIKQRSDFKADIDALVGELALCLNAKSLTSVALAASPGNKGVDGILAVCPTGSAWATKLRQNWRNNLLYTRPLVPASVNGQAGCNAVLLFAGERTQRTLAPLGPQQRATEAQTGSATLAGDAAMYLEGPNTVFPHSGAYAGAAYYDGAQASADVVRCIKGLSTGSAQLSFASNLASFDAVGLGVAPDVSNSSVKLGNVASASSGCLWWPQPLALAGKTLRVYLDFKFAFADSFALSGGGLDRGNGFTLSFVSGDNGAPTGCGSVASMGSLDSADPWGSVSIVIETDVHRDANPVLDPAHNHSAIGLDGHLDHAQIGDSLSAACDGSASGCAHAIANQFEESPLATHHQRTEIHSGCNSDCSACNPPAHAAPHNFLRVATWVDCVDCSDIVSDQSRSLTPPTVQRCVPPNAALNSVYFGLTGGFLSGSRQQGVSLSALALRSE